ncbi:MAG: molecular chaperone [Candidatus Methylomirabilia bacterium]
MAWELAATLARSATYKLLALAFLPPRPEGVLHLFSALPRIIQDLPEGHQQGLGPIVEDLPSIRTEPGEGEYIRLFSVGLTATPYESEYDPLVATRKGHRLADLLGFYEAFGFRLADGLGEFPDHVAVELEFMSLLLLKAAHAAVESHGEGREISEQAAVTFLADHLGAWGEAFADRVEAATESDAYRFAARLLGAFLLAECQLLGVEPVALTAAPPGGTGPPTCPFVGQCAEG